MRAIDVANIVIKQSQEHEIPVTNLRLQKLLYFVQKKMLQTYDRKAFDDAIEAWQYGPVVREVYNEFSDCVDMQLMCNDEIYIEDEELESVVEKVLSDNDKTATWKLVKLTHEKDSPWDRAYRKNLQFIDINDIKTLNN